MQIVDDTIDWAPPNVEQWCPICQEFHHPTRVCDELELLLRIADGP